MAEEKTAAEALGPLFSVLSKKAPAQQNDRSWKLSPSDFAFLWEECKRCFYLKIVSEFPRPRSIMPKIFNVIDSQMKSCFEGKRTEAVAPTMPPGVVRFSERWVESKPIALPDHASTCFVRGKFDTVVKFDDGSYGVIDFKTSEVRGSHISLYSRQLHAYAYALENPSPGNFALQPVSRLGLLVFEPKTFANEGNGSLSLTGNLGWLEIERDDKIFLEFLAEVLSILERSSPPDPSPNCDWCNYRSASRDTRY